MHPVIAQRFPSALAAAESTGVVLADDLREVEHRLHATVSDEQDAFLGRSAIHLIEAGGKRLRPMMALLGGRFGPDPARAVDAAVIAELVHVGTLYHDDVMDEASVRHGVVTANTRWGNTVAVLLGDYLIARAAEISARMGRAATELQVRTLRRLVRGQMAMLHNYAHAYFTLGGYQKSVDYAAQALPLSQQIGDRRSEAEIVKWSGMASWLLGELDRSVEFLTRALTLYQQVGNTFGEMNAHVGLGIAYDDMGDWDRALYHDEAALTLSRSIGNKYGEALALQNFGMVYGQLGRFAEALTRHNRSLRLYQEVGTRFQESSAHYAIAVIHRDTGRYDEAITSAQRALTLARDTSDHRTEANALNTLGTTCTQLSRFAEAIAHHDLAAAQ
ncbi:tetratricopeptide repeat protein, partial [Kibdelosporangium lantanae]